MTTRAEVLTQARSYLHTPYENQGRSSNKLDCVGLALCVAEDLAIVDKKGERILRSQHSDYSGQPIGEDLLKICRERLIEKTFPLAPGDVLVLAMDPKNAGRDATHLGIVTFIGNLPAVIHSYAGGKARVVEHVLDSRWMARIRGIFSFPGVT
jgi:cell wall-associated NlpC family hydrolase